MLIGLVGLLLGYASRAADLDVDVILAFYALLFLTALPLLRLRPRTLLCLSLALAVAAPVALHLLRGVLPEPGFDGDPVLTDVFTDPLGLLSDLLVHGDYPVPAWTAYLCAGLAVGRMDLTSKAVAKRLLTGGAALAAAAWLTATVLLRCSTWRSAGSSTTRWPAGAGCTSSTGSSTSCAGTADRPGLVTHEEGGAMPVISDPVQFNEEELYVDLRAALGLPLYLKCEGFNFAGSIKIKAATEMVNAAERDGVLRPGSVLVESSSGNLGVALSVLAASRGYRFLCITDARCNEPTIRLMEALVARGRRSGRIRGTFATWQAARARTP